MKPEPHLRTGDRVLITFGGATFEGTVALASPNGSSLILAFKALLSGDAGSLYVGALSVDWEETGFVDLVMRRPVLLKKW